MKEQGEKSIRRNFAMNAVLALSSVLFPLIAFRYASRIVLPEGTGRVSFAVSLIAYFSMFAQLGIPTYGIRACAKVRDDRQALTRTVHELLGINIGMDGLAYALLALALVFIPRLAEDRLLIGIVSMTVFLNSIGMEWLYKGLEQYTYITARSIIFKVIALGALFLLVHEEGDVLVYGGITIFASSASNVLNFVHARKFVDIRRPKDCDWKRHLRPVCIFFAMSCAATVYTHLDELMLGFMKTNADVGYYTAAVKVKNILVTVVTALGAVLLPRSAYYVEQGKMAEFREISQKALRFILLAAAPVMLYFTMYAEECILFLSGEKFLLAVTPMRVIMPTVLLIGLTNLMGMQTLVPLGREKTVLVSEICGAVTDLVLNLILIPAYGATGAAIGTLAAEAVVLGVQYAALRKEIREFFVAYRWLRLLAGLAAGTSACLWVHWTGMGTIWKLVVSAGCFFGVYFGWMAWRKEETVEESVRIIKKRIVKSEE